LRNLNNSQIDRPDSSGLSNLRYGDCNTDCLAKRAICEPQNRE